jgi:hypothetical protein
MAQAMNREDDGNYVVGYMCRVDYECELGAAAGGNVVFPSLEDAKQNLRCADACGIVEVEVRYRKTAMVGSDEH